MMLSAQAAAGSSIALSFYGIVERSNQVDAISDGNASANLSNSLTPVGTFPTSSAAIKASCGLFFVCRSSYDSELWV
jgi:hypothetical protein